MAIQSFKGENAFLSNFFPCSILLDGAEYPTVEHAYQAAKTLNHSERWFIAHMETPEGAKRMGRTVAIRIDWGKVKINVMKQCLIQKFASPSLALMLLSTGDQELIEGNTWGDTFWGVCNGVGQNMLGQLLMEVRSNLLTIKES